MKSSFSSFYKLLVWLNMKFPLSLSKSFEVSEIESNYISIVNCIPMSTFTFAIIVKFGNKEVNGRSDIMSNHLSQFNQQENHLALFIRGRFLAEVLK